MAKVRLTSGSIVSDTHLGGGGPGDDFSQNEELFGRYLHYCHQERVPLVLLGDIFELHGYHWKEIFSAHTIIFRLMERLRRDGLLYIIIGNHDEEMGILHGVFPGIIHDRLDIDTGQLLIHCEHGNRYDPLNRRPGLWQRALTSFATRLECFWKDADVVRRAGLDKKLQGVARNLLIGGDQDIVVFGHTHHPAEVSVKTKSGIKHYYNTGSWTGQTCHAFEFSGGRHALRPVLGGSRHGGTAVR